MLTVEVSIELLDQVHQELATGRGNGALQWQHGTVTESTLRRA